MDADDIALLLEQARNYRRLGNAMQDRMTRLALLELAFEFEQRAETLGAARFGPPRRDRGSRKSDGRPGQGRLPRCG